MADGQLNKSNIGAIIQARMQSSRLPGKILMPLPFPTGKPIIEQIVENLSSNFIENIFIASSENKENDPLEKFCQTKKIICFRGSEENVLSRFITIIEAYNLDHVIRLTGDNPIVDNQSLSKVLEVHLTNQNDYTNSSGLPLGMNIEVAKASSLLEASTNTALTKDDLEHVTLFLKKNKKYKKETINFNSGVSNLRMTIDYPADFAMFSVLFTLNSGVPPTLEQLKRLLEENLWIKQINENAIQKQHFNDLSEEVEYAYNLLKSFDLHYAANLLKSGK